MQAFIKKHSQNLHPNHYYLQVLLLKRISLLLVTIAIIERAHVTYLWSSRPLTATLWFISGFVSLCHTNVSNLIRIIIEMVGTPTVIKN